MEFVEGQQLVVIGSSSKLRQLFHYLPVHFFHQGKKVLILDTTNSINPHHKLFNDSFQKSYFEQTYCVRTPLPYDLWARLQATENFIKKKNISVILVTSLSLIFRDVPINETGLLVKNITEKLKELTLKNNLITIIGNSEDDSDSIMEASYLLSKQDKVVEVST